ncbi:hypothetical protein [Alteribacter natronophilus]|uniref:hypothetical protein n=1 Tax=Alteribacter natronophilus TaxID=2583810 RepID=UPI00110EEFD6|nr:hypothetical protein [Alteribacter natronophilus]TMW71060.1 hypothetical protein FGB90_13910 [Alteribacter natronophilus]
MKNGGNEQRFKEDDALVRYHMKSDHVDVPEIPVRRSRLAGFFRYLGSPARNPFDRVEVLDGGAVRLAVLPAAAGAGLMILQAGVYLFL